MKRSFRQERPELVTGAAGLMGGGAERAQKMLDWSRVFTLDTGIGRTISWYCDFLGGSQ